MDSIWIDLDLLCQVVSIRIEIDLRGLCVHVQYFQLVARSRTNAQMLSGNKRLSSPLFEMAACAGWNVEETRPLVSLWSENNAQCQLVSSDMQ